MAKRRYEISLQVLKNISQVSTVNKQINVHGTTFTEGILWLDISQLPIHAGHRYVKKVT